MSILSKATTGAMIAGAALLVAACGGGAANNTANAVSNEPVVMNEPMAPDMNGGMPVDNTMPPPADMNSTNTTTTTTTTNTTNGM
jgi:hypothetical protein